MDGLDRSTMADSRNRPAGRPGTGRWTGSSMEGSPHCIQRDFVGFANGCALEGPAAAVWFVPDRAPALPELGAFRGDGAVAPRPSRAPQGGGRPGSHGVLCGRDLCPGQKRGRCVGKTKRGKGTKIMGIADGHGLPLALRTESASPAEVKLVAATLEARVVAEVPERLIGDKAYDSDRLDEQLLREFGTEMIAPNKINRRVPTQDGRPLRRYVRRYKIERLFAWLFNFRRLVVRYEYHAENFQGFVHLAAAVILLRHL